MIAPIKYTKYTVRENTLSPDKIHKIHGKGKIHLAPIKYTKYTAREKYTSP